jgi:hypothetical protein
MGSIHSTLEEGGAIGLFAAPALLFIQACAVIPGLLPGLLLALLLLLPIAVLGLVAVVLVGIPLAAVRLVRWGCHKIAGVPVMWGEANPQPRSSR